MTKDDIIKLAKEAGYEDLPTVRLAYQGFDIERFATLVAAAQRKPLTDEDIAEVAERMEATDATSSFWREFARAIEAAHNIKEWT